MYKGMEVNPESCANVKLHEMGSKRGSEYKPRFYL